MKALLVVMLAALASAVATPFGRADDAPKREAKPRFKGVELYSWKDEKSGWQFALLSGTNDLKAENRIKTAPTVYAGTDKLADALKLLAEGESVSWTHHVAGFEYPPAGELKKIDDAAKAAKVKLRRPEK
jgi:hypothetical protein